MLCASLVVLRWKQDAITLIDKLLPERYQEVIIVGGGVGGWIATLIALERPEKGADFSNSPPLPPLSLSLAHGAGTVLSRLDKVVVDTFDVFPSPFFVGPFSRAVFLSLVSPLQYLPSQIVVS